MQTFSFVQLEPGEQIVFGIVTETSSTSMQIQGIQVGGSSNETRKGITDRRVIIEASTGGVTMVGNGDVKKVTIKREKEMGAEMLRIVSVTDSAGRTHAVGVGMIDPSQEPRIQQLFPQAALDTKKKGLFSFLGF